jgi:probable HAF family extracellular repeat protein
MLNAITFRAARHASVVAIVFGASGAGLAHAQQVPRYELRTVLNYGDSSCDGCSAAGSLNEAGEVLYSIWTSVNGSDGFPEDAQSFFWRNGRATPVEAPPRFIPVDFNERGWVIGVDNYRPAILKNGTEELIPIPGPPGYPFPASINNLGHAAGYTLHYDPDTDTWTWGIAFVYKNGVTIDLTKRNQMVQVSRINDDDQITGRCTKRVPDGSLVACYIQNGITRYLGHPNLQRGSIATKINAKGQTIGTFLTASGLTHGYVLQQGVLTDLGQGYFPYDINDAGTIVGEAPYPMFSFIRAGGKVHSVRSLVTNFGGFHIDSAYEINERGEIIGKASRVTFPVERKLYVLRPIP